MTLNRGISSRLMKHVVETQENLLKIAGDGKIESLDSKDFYLMCLRQFVFNMSCFRPPKNERITLRNREQFSVRLVCFRALVQVC